MKSLKSRLDRLEGNRPNGDRMAHARAFARVCLEVKTGCKVDDASLLDRLAAWGAPRRLSIPRFMDILSKIDRMASYFDSEGKAKVEVCDCADIEGRTAEDIKAMLERGQIDEKNILSLYGIAPPEVKHEYA